MRGSSQDAHYSAQLAARVAHERAHHGWSLRRLAKEAGLSLTTLRTIESGESNPELETLLRLQATLGLASIEELLGDMPSQRAAAALPSDQAEA